MGRTLTSADCQRTQSGLRVTNNWMLFRQGMISAISNSKTLLLYTAFIPPFLNPANNVYVQTAVIALTYAVVEFIVEFLIASAAQSVRPWFVSVGQRFNRFCGALFVAFGAALPIHL